ncbi:DUF3795 domain-containing protein [Desulfogranum mediterraneum]|uniref:DUF3795 domain-containing protein n=1 Tax=Desulfogranum mediterraneum TaxID=160661 RepID=UPI000A009658|nr:DUF3795 domain-containing protein [Desulfogranum mediterraneum]
MIAYCGMDCEKCEGYLATQENSDAKRVEVAEKWSREHNADIKPEQINCTGCKSEGLKFFFTENMCPVRKCNRDKDTVHCAKCSQYRCETLEAFIKEAPPVGEALENLR